MKIRYGFVTNSSSSSFIVSFQSAASMLEELTKENLTTEDLGLVMQSLTGGSVMTYKEALAYVSREIVNDIEYKRWDENRRNGISQSWDAWDAPLTGKWLEEKERRVAAIMENIGKDAHTIQVEEGDEGFNDGKLEHEILPRLTVTKAVFSHH